MKPDGSQDEAWKDAYHKYATVILAPKERMGNIRGTFNFPIVDCKFDTETFLDCLKHVYRKSQKSFKVNVSFSLLLRHVKSNDIRYYYMSAIPSYSQRL